jgi:hypothetical protein
MRFSRRQLITVCAVVLTWFVTPVGLARAQSPPGNSTQSGTQIPTKWNAPVRMLADKIVDLASTAKTVSLSVENVSSLHLTEVATIRQLLETELGRRHFRLVQEANPEAQVVVTLSEDVDSYIWAAQFRAGSTEQTAIMSVPRGTTLTQREMETTMTLRRTVVWEGPEPILDFDKVSADATHSTLFVLGINCLLAYRFEQNAQPSKEEAPVPVSLPVPRDPRGRIVSAESTHVTAWLELAGCAGFWYPTFQVSCGPNMGNIPSTAMHTGEISPEPGRNYFDPFSPYYSEASPPDTKPQQSPASSLRADVDGKTRLYEKSSFPDRLPEATTSLVGQNTLHASAVFDWGDQIVTIVAPCDAAWHVLATGTGDWTQTDHLQIYEIRDREAIPVGQRLELPGPILSLSSSSDLKSARMVSRNLQTGMYEASIVSVSCTE